MPASAKKKIDILTFLESKLSGKNLKDFLSSAIKGRQGLTDVQVPASEQLQVEAQLKSILNRLTLLENAVFGKDYEKRTNSKEIGPINEDQLLEYLVPLAERSNIAPWVKVQNLLDFAGIKSPTQAERIRSAIEQAFLNDKIDLAEGAASGSEQMVKIRGKLYGRIRKI